MTLDVAYSYCSNLTEEEKLEIDKQVRENQLALKLAIYIPLLPFPIPQPPVFPGEVFLNPQQVVRNAQEKAESAIEQRVVEPLQ